MTKRRLEKDIEDLGDELLSDLKADERLRVLLKGHARGEEGWIDQLIETAPRYNYSSVDAEFITRERMAKSLAQQAVYDLHTTYLQYQLVRQKQRYERVLSYMSDEEPSEEELEEFSAHANEIRELFATLYMLYHGCRRFASEVIGVDAETWLAYHPNGEAVLEMAASAVDDQTQIELAEEHFDGSFENAHETEESTQTGDEQEGLLEKAAELHCSVLARIWEDSIENNT